MFAEGITTAYVLHSRPFTDRKILVDWFSEAGGRVSSVSRTSSRQSLAPFQPFSSRCVSFRGARELKTLVSNEPTGESRIDLSGMALKCGFYINELVSRLLSPDQPEPSIYHAYTSCLSHLGQAKDNSQENQRALRNFELDCISGLGYGIDFVFDGRTGSPIERDESYYLEVDDGFVVASSRIEKQRQPSFLGSCILDVHQRRFECPQTRDQAKKICRMLLAPHLGDRPLKSRELFR